MHTGPKIPFTGKPTENPNDKVIPGRMRSDREEIPDGFTKEDADKAEIAEAKLKNHRTSRSGVTALASPTDCMTYWPEWRYTVCGLIRVKYDSLGGSNSFLKFPISNELANPDGVGKRSEFMVGPIYWHPNTGAHPVVNSFMTKWGSHGWEGGFLGYPKTDEIVNPDNTGRRQEFNGAVIYWHPTAAPNAAVIGGAIRDKWGQTGWEGPGGLLGYPTTDEIWVGADNQGRMNRFERGVIYWHPTTAAYPVTGTILTKWELSGYERGPYGYPASDQRPRGGGGNEQDFQYGVMGRPTDIAETAADQGDINFTVADGKPTSWSELAADAAVGRNTSRSPAMALGKGLTYEACTSGKSCLQAPVDPTILAVPPEQQQAPTPFADDDPNIEGPDTGGYFVPGWCTSRPRDAVWHGYRKNACLTGDTELTVHNLETGALVGRYGFTIKTGILSSHRDGEMSQEFRFEFDTPTGSTGSPKFMYSPRYSGFGSNSYSVDGPASGTLVTPGKTIVIVVTWKEQAQAVGAVDARNFGLDYHFANTPPYSDSTAGYIGSTQFRCDTTMRNSQGYKQGCVYAPYVPDFTLSNASHPNPTPQAAGHIQSAIQSGLPGGSASRPLHRQADTTTRDINRQASCPRTGSIANARAVSGRSCDEYPFASTTEGGASSGGGGRTFNPQCHVPDLGASSASSGYSACMIDAPQNSLAGSYLGAFYGTQRVINQDPFYVVASGGSLPPTP